MTFIYTLAWWHIPLAVTTLAMLWAFFWPAEDGGYLGGIVRLFMLVPALFISCLAWGIAGVFK